MGMAALPPLSENPFALAPDAPLADNPFINAPDAPAALVSTGPTCGDPDCVRSHRPANSPYPGTHYSPDASTKARELIEDGKFGASFGHLSQGTNRKSKKRAAEIVAEFAVEASDKIKKAFADGLADDQSVAVRQSSALHVLSVEARERELQLKEQDQQFKHMGKDELLDSIMTGLAALSRQGELAEGVVDAEVVDSYDLSADDDDY